MSDINRRNFVKLAGAAGAASGLTLAGCASGGGSGASNSVVVVGGGYGGAIAAKYLKKIDPSLDVTLVEMNKTYTSCPGSNWVFADIHKLSDITFTYDKLASKYGIKVVHDKVTGIDGDSKMVKLASGGSIPYARCIVSPGIDFKYGAIEGYTEASTSKIPHAWKAGPQTDMLHKQLQAMPDGGTFVIVPPPNPFRCPPGPGERISLVAHYFKNHKPKSKIVALDVKGKFSKQGLFKEGWGKMYGDMIDYRSQTKVEAIEGMTAITEVDEIKADVLNVVPAQQAGKVAQVSGLTDKSGWCPVKHGTFESKMVPGVHVIGDASIASPMPKSGYAANSQAKVCAAAVVALLKGQDPETPSWVNTCYSLVGPSYGISVAMVYNFTDKGMIGKVKGSGGLSPKGGNRQIESIYAKSWLANITDDMFG